MNIREFCRHHTKKYELCVIRESGWIIATVWIDAEDLFSISDRVAKLKVKSDEWGTLYIDTGHGNTVDVPCHYIDC